MKKTKIIVLLFAILILVCGCDATGSLSTKEEQNLMKYLVDHNYIDKKCVLDADGIGEGELFEYYCDITKNNKDYTMNVTQCIRKDNYRVFCVSLYEKESQHIYKKYNLKINRQDASVSLYQEK